MDWLFSPEIWISLITLASLEIILGVDNLVLITILSGRLPEAQRPRARRVGLVLALGTRIALLTSIAWLARMTVPLFTLGTQEISVRDLVLLLGGLFLIYKATKEIHGQIEGEGDAGIPGAIGHGFAAVVIQIALFDIIFSLDSVITAVGMAQHLGVMIAAIMIAVGVMLWGINIISDFIDRNPTVRMLALSFLLLVGFALMAESLHVHIPRTYMYVAMAYSAFVEVLNSRARKRQDPKFQVIEEAGAD